MLSHAEAQALVSARLDGRLDAIAERELEAHLATCASCRAFNTTSMQLSRGLRAMPFLPSSPAVSRAVLDHINTPRKPWNVVAGPWVGRAIPVMSAVAAALVLTVLGVFALQRLDGSESPLDAVTSFLSGPAPETEPPDSNVAFQTTEQATNGEPTSESEATDVPSAPEPTDASDTSTTSQTDQEEPAAPAQSDASEPAPTQADTSGVAAPTQPSDTGVGGQSEPDDTAGDQASTEDPVEERIAPTSPATEAPDAPTATTATDLRIAGEGSTPGTPDPTATAVPTDVPTEVPTQESTATVPPTEVPPATAVPTEVPTATSAPTELPTATAVPTDVPTEVPAATATPEPTATAVPTEVPTATVPPTEVPTATAVPTEEPTATTVPTEVPTATAVPTEVPTATVPPTEVPTATAVPTEEPTATTVPTEVPTATAVPTDVPTEVPTEEANEQIIEPVDGTVVDADDDEATQEDRPASVDQTPEAPIQDDITPTAAGDEADENVVPIEAETPVDDSGDYETPPSDDEADEADEAPESGDGEEDGAEAGEAVIEPIDGAEATQETTPAASDEDGDADQTTEASDEPVVETPSGDGGADETPESGDGDEDGAEAGEGVIEPIDGAEATQDTTPAASDEDGDADKDDSGSGNGDDEPEVEEGVIEPSDDVQATERAGDDGSDEVEDDSGDGDSGSGNTDEGASDSGPSLGSANEVGGVSDIPGDPGTRLGVNDNSQLVFSSGPGAVSLESNGLRLDTGDGESGQAVSVCDASGSCIDVTSGSAGGSHTDTPLGWIGSDIIYERVDDDGVTFRAVQFDSESQEVLDDRVLSGGSETLTRPYPVDGGLLVPAQDAWLFISADDVSEIDDNPFGGDISLIRIAPSIDTIAYVAGGEIIVAGLGSPGSPQARIPFAGTDFDLSPDGTQVAVTDGSGIRILDMNGNVVQEFANDEGIEIGGITWLNRGIVYVDQTNGVIRTIDP